MTVDVSFVPHLSEIEVDEEPRLVQTHIIILGLRLGVTLRDICEEMSDICGEMNPFGLFCIGRSEFVFTLMVSSTVMVDIVFARFMFCTFYWR